MSKALSKFKTDQRGNIALVTALLGVPLVMAVTFTLDYQQALRESGAMQAAVDAAALSTVSNGQLSQSERDPYVRAVFASNYTGELEVKLDIDAKAGDVKVAALAKRDTIMGSLLSSDNVTVRRKAHAVLTQESVICLLTLDPNSKGSLTISGNATLSAPDCAVQVNSRHKEAIVANGASPPNAKAFCAVGGVKGNFLPYADSECSVVADPYKNLPVPKRGACIDLGLGALPFVSAALVGTPSEKGPLATTSSANKGKGKGDGAGSLLNQIVPDNMTLRPGTYCGGLTYSGVRIRLSPGVYHIVDGPLVFEKGAEVSGEDVTFILQGEGSNLQVEQGAVVALKGSQDGDYGGVAVYQVPSGGGVLPEATSFIKSGGRMNISGVLYFPTQNIELKGKSAFGAQAPATSFIAYNVAIKGQVDAILKSDHTAAGLPPIMPRSDAGPILIK